MSDWTHLRLVLAAIHASHQATAALFADDFWWASQATIAARLLHRVLEIDPSLGVVGRPDRFLREAIAWTTTWEHYRADLLALRSNRTACARANRLLGRQGLPPVDCPPLPAIVPFKRLSLAARKVTPKLSAQVFMDAALCWQETGTCPCPYTDAALASLLSVLLDTEIHADTIRKARPRPVLIPY